MPNINKCLALTCYTYDYYEFAELIAVAPAGPEGKSALIAKYNEVNSRMCPLFLSKGDVPVDPGFCHYEIEEVEYLG